MKNLWKCHNCYKLTWVGENQRFECSHCGSERGYMTDPSETRKYNAKKVRKWKRKVYYADTMYIVLA